MAQSAAVVVDEDVTAAHAGAFATFHVGSTVLNSGVICIAGTGANSFGIGENGQRARANGLGPLLGDRGSGYRIGEYALRAA
jgi:N-acetylglucosamine kinase-like BadF-type ATPase